MTRILLSCTLLAVFTGPAAAQADKGKPKGDPAVLTLERIFSSNEFAGDTIPAIRWRKNGGYVTIEQGKGGQQLVARDPATDKSEILVPDHWLIPAGENKALTIEGYEFSSDNSRLLIYTNSKRVWRVNSRGDYWLLDLSTRQKNSAAFCLPDDAIRHVFARRQTNRLRLQNNSLCRTCDLSIKALTTDGPTIINGTFDWVCEEELHPQRLPLELTARIACWQPIRAASGVSHHQQPDGPCPKIITIRYQNRRAKLGSPHRRSERRRRPDDLA